MRIVEKSAIETKIIYPDLSYFITGLLFQAHNKLGRYSNELQYADCIESLLKDSKINFEREFVIPPIFEKEFPGRNRVDFLIDKKIILELKAKRLLNKDDYYQTRRYLSALNLKLGILVNFRDQFLKPKRVLNSSA